MPLSEKGRKMLANFKKEYGEKKGKAFFYAYENKHKHAGIKKHSATKK